MNSESHQKITSAHLSRMAYLYVRQSTLRQVLENTESTQRQYALRERAAALGWPFERIVVIDRDLGQSGASAADREGFQQLVSEVSLGHVGIVLGLEVSRLARNSTDWHRLLELCAFADTLILDEDGLYNPGLFNDRLLLGLKGTMSEAELHVLKARLRGGILSRARRGELKQMLPAGFVHDVQDRVILDPDVQVQAAVRLFFETFKRTGSCLAVVKDFHARGLLFPRRLRSGAHKGELIWAELLHCRARQIIHNPRYAGAFVFGRTKQRHLPNGKICSRLVPSEEWILLRDVHPGYISWEEYQSNRQQVQGNALSWSDDRRRGPAREGNALLQGLVICGTCGERMTVRYHLHRGQSVPTYWCGRRPMHRGESGLCQTVHGGTLDTAIGDVVIEAMTPFAIEVALTVQQELASRQEEADRLRRQHVERARYEADLAQRRFLKVDPDNRLVADALEADWNARLRALADAQQVYERASVSDSNVVTDAERVELLALATDFPRLWRNPRTQMKEKKRMLRLLIEDITLTKADALHVDIRFAGGATRSLDLALPKSCVELRTTDAEVVKEIDQLIDTYTDGEIADVLNERGVRTVVTTPWTAARVGRLRNTYHLSDRRTRLLALGLLTPEDVAARYGVAVSTVHLWRRRGLLRAHPVNDRGDYLYEIPPEDLPAKYAHKREYRVEPSTTHSRSAGGAV
ncbi:recombinase family protein [Paraburkholderia terricola]|uniref:recombinase family protein n=1 Tax=Paraburkholderia terricola TaxID=169427 RepID=UPI00285A378F|nr:recombinase family protein [Paraburkholderia terricola]MDR6485505.1 DNA invertase Pin-like site-specific DNA recombinase [Paraburkholderia terricola]